MCIHIYLPWLENKMNNMYSSFFSILLEEVINLHKKIHHIQKRMSHFTWIHTKNPFFKVVFDNLAEFVSHPLCSITVGQLLGINFAVKKKNHTHCHQLINLKVNAYSRSWPVLTIFWTLLEFQSSIFMFSDLHRTETLNIRTQDPILLATLLRSHWTFTATCNRRYQW